MLLVQVSHPSSDSHCCCTHRISVFLPLILLRHILLCCAVSELCIHTNIERLQCMCHVCWHHHEVDVVLVAAHSHIVSRMRGILVDDECAALILEIWNEVLLDVANECRFGLPSVGREVARDVGRQIAVVDAAVSFAFRYSLRGQFVASSTDERCCGDAILLVEVRCYDVRHVDLTPRPGGMVHLLCKHLIAVHNVLWAVMSDGVFELELKRGGIVVEGAALLGCLRFDVANFVPSSAESVAQSEASYPLRAADEWRDRTKCEDCNGATSPTTYGLYLN